MGKCRCIVSKHGLSVRCGASTPKRDFSKLLCEVDALLRFFGFPDTDWYTFVCEDTYLLQRDERGEVCTLWRTLDAASHLYPTQTFLQTGSGIGWHPDASKMPS